MKIKKRDLSRLIENYLKEENTDGGKRSIPGDKTEIGNAFKLAQIKKHGGHLPRDTDADILAVTDFRKGSDRGQFPPITFGPGIDDEGNLKTGEFSKVHDYREPDSYDYAAVQRYKKDHYIGPNEKSVGDPEHTILSFDDEKTEESPLGTQYSLDNTDELYRFDDKTIDDPGHTAHSGDDFYLKPEYEEDYEQPGFDDKTPARTYGLADEEKDENFLSRLRKKIFGK
jgi:hypothetical protein